MKDKHLEQQLQQSLQSTLSGLRTTSRQRELFYVNATGGNKVKTLRDVKIGEACILNVGALIDHHVEIGAGCHILMGAVVRNKAKVEPLTRVESLSLVE